MNVGDRVTRKDTGESGTITAVKSHLSVAEFTGDVSGPMGYLGAHILEASDSKPPKKKRKRAAKKKK